MRRTPIARTARLSLAAALLLPLPALARDTYQRVVPPPNVVEGLHKLAISDAGGPYAEMFGQGVATALRGRMGYTDGVPEADAGLRSDVLDFAHVHGPAVPGVSDVIQLGGSVGAQAVLTAQVDGKEVEYENFQENRKRRVKQSDGSYKDEEYKVSCARRVVEASGAWTLYGAGDGAVVTKDGFSERRTDSDCDEGDKDTLSVASAHDLIEGIVTRAAGNAAAQFAPRWERFPVKYAREQSTRDAIDAADDGDWVTAIEQSEATLADDPYNAAAVYHVGLGLELGGRAADAAVLYGFANRMKDLPMYGEALTRARKRTTELAQLATYGLAVKPVSYTGVDELLARANKAKETAVVGTAGTVKGAKNKRLPVLSAADGGDVLAMVPGGTDVRVVKAGDDFSQVQLPDGVQGWISAKYLK